MKSETGRGLGGGGKGSLSSAEGNLDLAGGSIGCS